MRLIRSRFAGRRARQHGAHPVRQTLSEDEALRCYPGTVLLRPGLIVGPGDE